MSESLLTGDGEPRLHELLGSIDVGVWYCDLPFDRLNWDERVKRHFWLPSDAEVDIELFYARLHPADRERTREAIERSIADRADYDITYRTVSPEGQVRWLRAIGRGFYNEAGEPVRFDGLTVDLSSRRETEMALRASQERLSAALQASATGTFYWKIQSDEIDWDESLDRLFGLPAGETVRTLAGFLELVHPEDRTHVVASCADSAQSGADFEMEFRILWPDGQVRWLYSRGKTKRDESGRPFAMAGACVDVSERKRADALLAERTRIYALGSDIGVALSREQPLRSSLQQCTEAIVRHVDAAFARIWTVSEDRQTLELQASAGMYTHLDGAHARVPIGQFKIGLIAQECKPHLTNDVQHDQRVSDRSWAVREGMVAFAGYPLVVDEELVGVVALFARQPLGEDVLRVLGATSSMIAVGINRKQNEIALAASRDAAQAASRAKSEFLAGMSHELRTPLNAIIGYSEMLQEEAGDRELENMVADLKKIRTAGKHLLSLINDILDLSKIEAGKMEVFPELFSVPALVHETVQLIQPLVERNGNRLAVEIGVDVGEMESDSIKLRQSLFNLLSNAAKFTQGGSVKLTVAAAGPDRYIFTVEDTGIGITPEQLERLFQPFQQGESSVSRKYGGTGLGLSLTQRFVRLIGGEVTVESTPGVGSRFVLILPRRLRTLRREREAVQTRPADGAAYGTVLVVDDDPIACDLLARTVTREGFRAVTVSAPELALERAIELRPDLITLDVMMAGMDGWSLLSKLKGNALTRQIPVVMVTIVDQRGIGFALGAADYLMKPLEREQLAGVLERVKPALNRCTVLVVDDDADARNLLEQKLSAEGWSVTTAGSGLEALARLAEAVPCLIVLDLIMPDMNGFEVIVELERHPEWNDIPVIVLTAKDLSPKERQQLNGHVEATLTKGSATPDDLVRQLRRVLHRSAPAHRAGESNP